MSRKKTLKQQRPVKPEHHGPPKGAKGIRRLSSQDDLGEIFSQDSIGQTPQNFASFFAGERFADALLSEILDEKGENLVSSPASPQARLRKSLPPQAQLDLHGCTSREAEFKTENFLRRAKDDHLRTVLVITGKGLHSPEGSVLKDVIESRLKIMESEKKILAYRWEKNGREQSGGLIVYLP